ncbi:MAG TPA: HypC/HybG/HupF family hydrogenase formation chaperone [Acidimicrobiia bacterium]|jgi:hydrogenase expression/formation protein HypC
MCVAVPGRVVAIGNPSPISIPATVDIGGVQREIDLVMIPVATVGDYVVTHSGYGIEIIPAQRAVETLALLHGSSGD